jgi:3-deoxy-D-manno-octulosonic-acid transferase
MIFIYRFLINLVFLFSPIIFIYRFIKKKEDKTRFIEKFSINTKKRVEGDLIWFHGASVGELQSITPIIEAISKSKNIKQILLTSNTLSSAKIVNKLKIKKIVHQYFPLDCNFIDKKFLNYWKPSKAIFIDSEIWPNMINNLHRKNIKIILVNARITKKSFSRWFYFPSFAKNIFRKIDLCLSSDKESYYYLKKLGAKNVKFYGNLKFAQSEKNNLYLGRQIK